MELKLLSITPKSLPRDRFGLPIIPTKTIQKIASFTSELTHHRTTKADRTETNKNRINEPVGDIGIGGQATGDGSELLLDLGGVRELVGVAALLRIRVELAPCEIRNRTINPSTERGSRSQMLRKRTETLASEP